MRAPVQFFLLVLSLGCFAACVESATGPEMASPSPLTPSSLDPTTARAYLTRPYTFRVAHTSTAEVTAKRLYLAAAEETTTLPMVGGEVTVQAQPGGHLVLTAMRLDLGDIRLAPESVPPNGLELKAVSLRLRAQTSADIEWASDDTANASTETDLVLDWSLVGVAGTAVPLASQAITHVPFEITIDTRPGGALWLNVHAERGGIFWEWLGLQLSDLRINLEAI